MTKEKIEMTLEEAKEKKYPTVKNESGKEVDYEEAVNLMDDDIREELHMELAPCSNQEFFDAYCARHLETFGESFEFAKENPVA